MKEIKSGTTHINRRSISPQTKKTPILITFLFMTLSFIFFHFILMYTQLILSLPCFDYCPEAMLNTIVWIWRIIYVIVSLLIIWWIKRSKENIPLKLILLAFVLGMILLYGGLYMYGMKVNNDREKRLTVAHQKVSARNQEIAQTFPSQISFSNAIYEVSTTSSADSYSSFNVYVDVDLGTKASLADLESYYDYSINFMNIPTCSLSHKILYPPKNIILNSRNDYFQPGKYTFKISYYFNELDCKKETLLDLKDKPFVIYYRDGKNPETIKYWSIINSIKSVYN